MEYSTLSETLACPVCLEVSIPPIYQCPKGHLICKDCLPKVKARDCPECPICRTPLPQEDIRSLSTEQLAESLDVKCKNASQGCKTISKVAGISQHLSNCQFTQDAWCLKMEIDHKCHEKYFLKDFPTHCRSHHAKLFIKVPSHGLKLPIRYNIKKIENHSQTRGWPPMFFELQNGDIYAVTSSRCTKEEMLTIKIHFRRDLHILSPAPDLKVPITVESSFCTLTWNLLPYNNMTEGTGPQELQLLETFSVSLKTLFPLLSRPQSLKWTLIFDFPQLK